MKNNPNEIVEAELCDAFALQNINELKARGPIDESPYHGIGSDSWYTERENQDKRMLKKLRNQFLIFLVGGVLGWFLALDNVGHNGKKFTIEDMIIQMGEQNEARFDELNKLENLYPDNPALQELRKDMEASGAEDPNR
jgi:hypothetical protein